MSKEEMKVVSMFYQLFISVCHRNEAKGSRHV